MISDWAAINQLPGDYASDIETSVNAGLDMIMVPDKYQEFINTTKTLVQENRIPIERINDAVQRILIVKFRMGLFENPMTNRTYTSTVGSSEHRQIARECVRQSLVLLKNNNNILPLRKDSLNIHVAGKNADDLGNQCGGWTISWQGSSGDITWGTNILQAIRTTVHSSTSVTYSYDGSGAVGSDVGIAVIGERPYAEVAGDRSNLNLDSEDLNTIQNFNPSCRAASARALIRPWYLYPPRSKATWLIPLLSARLATREPTSSDLAVFVLPTVTPFISVSRVEAEASVCPRESSIT